VKQLVIPVFAHRLTPDARFGGGATAATRGAQILEQILHTVSVPL
jgi:hypothetical protein